MKHLKKFEELDYLTILKKQRELEEELDKSRTQEIENRRKEISVQHSSKLSSETEKQSEMYRNLEERKELTHLIIQSLIFSEQSKEGFDNFKNDLKNLLNKYPLDKLPKSGSSIYR
jgi:hypothetical protein